MWPRVVIIILGVLLAGCDPVYGVESRATFHHPIDIACVNAALTSVPEASPVTYQHREDRSTEILPKQRKVLMVAHDWFYGEGGADILEVIQGPDEWNYRNSRSRMGVAVPHDEMVRFVPLMQKVNRAIEARCGLTVGNLQATAVGETKLSDI
jgi:hypothetical protein